MLENHPQIIKGREVVADDWSVLRLAEGESAADVVVPEGKVIVPLAVWQAQRAVLASRAALGIWIASDER
ncbi:MAG: oxidoreductase, partial [Telluria sp.]